MDTRKTLIVDALRTFMRQRPGMDPRNYDPAGYRSDARRVQQQRRDAETLLRAVDGEDRITVGDLLEASKSAFSGRLTLVFPVWTPQLPRGANMALCAHCGQAAAGHDYAETSEGRCKLVKIDYCTGQYWCTEYRAAVCAVLASALWHHVRSHCMPEPFKVYGSDDEWYSWKETPLTLMKPVSAGAWLRAYFRREFGRGIQTRWFS